MDEECDIVYFSADLQDIFTTKDMNTPIWYKKNADPKYICYCNYVTEEEIINTVLTHGVKTVREVVKITGAMKSCNCEINNPLGKCCMPYIQAAINKALNPK
jgi:NAD(P)H-nitrite reductase large subunit